MIMTIFQLKTHQQNTIPYGIQLVFWYAIIIYLLKAELGIRHVRTRLFQVMYDKSDENWTKYIHEVK